MTVAKVDQADATYSSLRTAIISLTPEDSKCRLYCKGRACRYCNAYLGKSAIPRLYSTWITDDILAMARPQPVHFENDEIIHNLKRKKVRAVFNLQEFGEHPSCGSGNLDGGFSYDPERLMRNDIFYYNFPLPDFEACTPARLVDIVTVMIYELTRGKVAVHCHAGHGRTGMVIAACLMLVRGLTPREAVDVVRQKRPGSVQSSDQVQALHSLRVLLINSASVLPASPFRTISEYIEYTGRVLPKMDMRRYGKVPKPLYIGFIALLRKFFGSVVLRLQSHAENPWRFLFDCKGPTDFTVTEEMLHLMSVDVTARGQAYYFRKVQRGINIINLEKYLMEEENIVELVSFIDFFMRTAFFQLTTTELLTEFLATVQSSEEKMVEDWSWSVCFVLSAICCLPQLMHQQFTLLLAEWFARGDRRTARSVYYWITQQKRSSQTS
ncbi:hypothetical protein V3C99_007760 [Haemonchus contortus]|uniref:TYR_PHOSPHATASE_2 domain-containing protein n=1 Tax=Haemonchus contortus TaxID=6289 RepID=A0A7I4YNN6_HAECO